MNHERLSYPDTIAKRDRVAQQMLDFLHDRHVDELKGGEREHIDRLERQYDRLVADTVWYEERAADREKIGRREHSKIHDPVVVSDDRYANLEGAQERALRGLEAVSDGFKGAGAVDVQDALIRKDPLYAQDFEVRSRPEYASAFSKILRVGSVGDAAVFMTDAERQSMADQWQARSMIEGQTTQGGFSVPVVLDPSVILTDQQVDNPFLRIARIENVTSNVWKGVSAAGASWSFDPEAQEVSDDSITLAQPSVTVFMARGFVPYSIEVSEDWSGFQAEMARVLAEGYNDLLTTKLTLGSGTGEPRGVVNFLDATASSEVLLTTAGQIGAVDIYNAWNQLPPKYHGNASWVASVGAVNAIRQQGAANVYHAFTQTLAAGSVDVLFGKQVCEAAYMAWTGTTGHSNAAVVGDFSNMVIARRTGLTVELVPHILGGSQRPLGMRGMFCYARVGSNIVNSAAFRLLNQT